MSAIELLSGWLRTDFTPDEVILAGFVAIDRSAVKIGSGFYLQQMLSSESGYTRLVREVCNKAGELHGIKNYLSAKMINTLREKADVDRIIKIEGKNTPVKGRFIYPLDRVNVGKRPRWISDFERIELEGETVLSFHPHNSDVVRLIDRGPEYACLSPEKDCTLSAIGVGTGSLADVGGQDSPRGLSFNKQIGNNELENEKVDSLLEINISRDIVNAMNTERVDGENNLELSLRTSSDWWSDYSIPLPYNNLNGCDNSTYRKHYIIKCRNSKYPPRPAYFKIVLL
jgi:hypothetical protein